MSKQIVLITGISGFVGASLATQLVQAQSFGEIRSVSRRAIQAPQGVNNFVINDLGAETDFSDCLYGVDTVVHLAGLVPNADNDTPERIAAFRLANVELTANLARHAIDAGVKRFVFVSSIKVNGSRTVARDPFREADTPDASGGYAVSKLEAESRLWKIRQGSLMEVCIVRPPLVYGPGVKSNFNLLVKLARFRIPLPLGSATNPRSFIGINNLVDFLLQCISHPKAGNELFLVSDGEDISAGELYKKIAKAVGSKGSTPKLPAWMVRLILTLVGSRHVASSLFDSMQIDLEKSQRLLEWKPPVTIDQQLVEMMDRER